MSLRFLKRSRSRTSSGDGPSRALDPRQLPGQALVEGAAVREPGELVGAGRLLEPVQELRDPRPQHPDEQADAERRRDAVDPELDGPLLVVEDDRHPVEGRDPGRLQERPARAQEVEGEDAEPDEVGHVGGRAARNRDHRDRDDERAERGDGADHPPRGRPAAQPEQDSDGDRRREGDRGRDEVGALRVGKRVGEEPEDRSRDGDRRKQRRRQLPLRAGAEANPQPGD